MFLTEVDPKNKTVPHITVLIAVVNIGLFFTWTFCKHEVKQIVKRIWNLSPLYRPDAVTEIILLSLCQKPSRFTGCVIWNQAVLPGGKDLQLLLSQLDFDKCRNC